MPAPFAGFWRRLGAFLLDCLLLGAIGTAAGYLFVDELARLGPWGRLLGFCIALPYFALLNSRLTQGQTPGKRLLKIKVVDKDGSPLSIPRSFIRFLPVGAPWFLNNAQFSESVFLSPWRHVLTLAIFGVGLSVVYLFVFNRATRRSVQDLMVGSHVVSAASVGPVESPPLPRVHVAVCAVLLVAAGVVPYFTNSLSENEPFSSLLSLQRSVSAEPWVVYSKVQQGTSMPFTDQGNNTTQYLTVTAFLKDPDIGSAERAKQLATLALSVDSSVRTLNIVQVTLVYGYDIGIASSWRSQDHAHTPAEWLSK